MPETEETREASHIATRYRLLTASEHAAYMCGHVEWDSAVETEHGVMVPTSSAAGDAPADAMPYLSDAPRCEDNGYAAQYRAPFGHHLTLGRGWAHVSGAGRVLATSDAGPACEYLPIGAAALFAMVGR